MTYEDDDKLDETFVNEAMQDPEGKRLAKIQEMYDTNRGELGKAMVKSGEVDALIYHRHIFADAINEKKSQGLIGPEGLNLLSLGCGTGKLYPEAIEDVDIHVDGIDISSYEGHRNPKMRFQQGSILAAPEEFDLQEQYDFIDSVFVLRYINAIPEATFRDISQRSKVVGVLNAYLELTSESYGDSDMTGALESAIGIIESGETEGLDGVLNNPPIAKAFLFTNWADKLADGGVMAHTITLQPRTSGEKSKHSANADPLRQAKAMAQLLERRKDLNLVDFVNILSKDVRKNMAASFGFLNALADDDIRAGHEEHDYFNKITDVQNALLIFGRIMRNAGHQVEIDLDVMDAADTAYIKIKKIS